MSRLTAAFRHSFARLVLAGAVTLASGSAALAQDYLVMPYTCSAFAGRVILNPAGREEGYRIFGQREERPFTMCSPINPSVCRNWTLYRFDLDCGGTRVDWMSVVEAASQRSMGRAWVENGRMFVRMNQYAGRDADFDEPCPRWRRRGPYGDDCVGRGYQGRGVVELPPGFAPAFGLQVKFMRPDHPMARAEPPLTRPEPSTRFDPPPGRADSTWPPVETQPGNVPGKTARIEPPREMPFKEAPFKEAPVKEAPVKEAPQATAPAPPPTATPKTAARPVPAMPETPKEAVAPTPPKPKRVEPPQGAVVEPVTPGGSVSVVPKVINRPDATPAPGGESPPATKPEPSAKPAPGTIPIGAGKTPAEQAKLDAHPDEAPGQTALSAFTPSATTQAIVGFAGLVAAALALFVWNRRREQLSLAATGRREFGAVSLDGRRRQPSPGRALARPSQRIAPPQPPPVPATSTVVNFPVPEDYLPRSREDAARVLGAYLEADEAAIAKIVENLRQRWHPDLASSDSDRQMRQRRIAQIDAAWDILCGKRATA